MQPPRTLRRLRRRHDAPLLHDLERVDREDALGPGFDLDAAGAAQPQRLADRTALHAEANDRAAAEKGAAARQVPAPVVIVKFLI